MNLNRYQTKQNKMDIYNIDGIIGEALRSNIDISPSDRQEWRMFCCALKVLGYDEATFIALSSGRERDSRQAWRAERSPSRYRTEDSARGMIVALAKSAGMDVKPFLLSQDRESRTQGSNDRRPTYRPTTPKPEPPTAPPVYITPQQIEAAAKHYRETSLYIWLCTEFDRAEVEEVMKRYRIGGSSFAPTPEGYRAASLPYISTAGNCVDCKLQQYDPTTGSRKGKPINWALKRIGLSDRRAPWCNFGNHLLNTRPTEEICIVEAEKSALILSLAYPGKIWIATGSKQNLTPERFAPYRGRNITVFPDRDGVEQWRSKAEELAAEGYAIRIDTTITKHPGEAKDDLADIVLRFRNGEQHTEAIAPTKTAGQMEAEQIFEQMKADNPTFAEFADLMELTAVSVEPYNPKPNE